MANSFSNIKDAQGLIIEGAAALLQDNASILKTIGKVNQSELNGKNGYSSGDTVYVNTPPIVIPTSSFDQTSTIQDTVETRTALSLDIISSVALSADTPDFASKVQVANYFDHVVKPAINDMGHDIVSKFINKMKLATYNSVGTVGSGVFDTDTILSAKERIGKYLAPLGDDRHFIFDGTAGRAAVNARKGLFQSSSAIAEQYKSGVIGMADSFTWHESELIPVHTNGNDVTGVSVKTTLSTEGTTTMTLQGLTNTTGTVTAGSTFTIANVYAVHPITKTTYPFLQKFVVVTGGTANGSGELAVTVSPAIYTSASGGLQTVNSFPQSSAALVFDGTASTTFSTHLAYHKDAFKMISAPMVMPTNAEFAEQRTVNGITIAIVRDFDILKRRMITRLDFLGGLCAPRAGWSTRVVG